MTKLGAIVVRPLYAQVTIEAEGAIEVPVPSTGLERVLANDTSILVATHPDHKGDLSIEVHRGTDDDSLGEKLFSGKLTLSTPRLVVGNQIGNRLLTVDVGRTGRTPVDIYVDDLEAPTHINVVVR